MPNSYTVFPNILPGNVTIGGNLTIAGDKLILGSSVRKTRLLNLPPDAFALTHNWDVAAPSQDDGAFAGISKDASDLTPEEDGTRCAAGAPGVGIAIRDFRSSFCDFGTDEVQIGIATPVVRVAKFTGGAAGVSWNLGTNLLTRDSVGLPGAALLLNGTGFGPEHAITGDGLANTFSKLASELVHLAGVTTVTGTVAETDFFNRTVSPNVVRTSGGFAAQVLLLGTTQGGVASTFRFRFGGTILDTFTKAATATIIWTIYVINQGAANSQEWFAWRMDSVAGLTVARGTAAVDSTLSQAFRCTIQPGAVADSWAMRCAHGAASGIGVGT